MTIFDIQAVFGVKGRSVLHTLTDFDVIENNAVDYMHCVLLRVFLTVVSYWFDGEHIMRPLTNTLPCVCAIHVALAFSCFHE